MKTGVFRLRLTAFREARNNSEIRQAWERLLATHDHPNVVLSSPEWAEHSLSRGARIDVLTVRNETERIVGLVPLGRHRFGARDAFAARLFGVAWLDVRVVLGGAPLLPKETSVAETLLEFMFDSCPMASGILFDALPSGSPIWNLGNDTARCLAYSPFGIGPRHVIYTGQSFDQYCAQLDHKFRYNTERRIRRLREKADGKLDLVCLRSPEEVPRFVAEAEAVRSASWQRIDGPLRRDPRTTAESFMDLARRGLWRSYLLRVAGRPVAFVFGFQDRGVYYFDSMGYDAALSRYSPGIAILSLAIQDIFATERPRLISFGPGASDFKRRLSNSRTDEGMLFLLRPNAANRLRVSFDRRVRRSRFST